MLCLDSSGNVELDDVPADLGLFEALDAVLRSGITWNSALDGPSKQV